MAAQAATVVPTPTGTQIVVNNGAGADHTDPHVSGDIVSYTVDSGASSIIHYFNLATGVDSTIPNPSAFDYLSAVDNGRIVFSRSTLGTSGAIYLYDIATGTQTELDPLEGASRDSVSIGGDTVAWQDRTTNPNAQIVAYDLASGVATPLTIDPTRSNLTPDVSPDGLVVAWVSCLANGTGCDLWDATKGAAGWTSRQLTTTPEISHPSTNGQIVVYARGVTFGASPTGALYYQPVTGGPEQNITVPASAGVAEGYPSLDGNLVSFGMFASGSSWTTWVADLVAGTIYQVSSGPESPPLSDISLGPTGMTNVAWQVLQGGRDNIVAFRYQVTPDAIAPTTTATPLAGRSSGGLGISVHIDSATVTPGGTLGPITCFNTAGLNVALNAVDNPGGSGVKQITYALSGAQVQPPTTIADSSVTVPITTNGTTTLTYNATDNAGNLEAQKALTVFVAKWVPVACAAAPASIMVPPHGSVSVTGTITITNPSTGQTTTYPFSIGFRF